MGILVSGRPRAVRSEFEERICLFSVLAILTGVVLSLFPRTARAGEFITETSTHVAENFCRCR